MSQLSRSFQGMPRLDTPFLDANGNVSVPWYRFLLSLMNRAGLNTVGEAKDSVVASFQNGSVFRWIEPVGEFPVGLQFFDQVTGAFLGGVYLGFTPTAAVSTPLVGTSPWIYQSLANGTLFVYNDSNAITLVEISADGVTYYPAGNTGGAYPMNENDFIRVTWGAGTTEFTFFTSAQFTDA